MTNNRGDSSSAAAVRRRSRQASNSSSGLSTPLSQNRQVSLIPILTVSTDGRTPTASRVQRASRSWTRLPLTPRLRTAGASRPAREPSVSAIIRT